MTLVFRLGKMGTEQTRTGELDKGVFIFCQERKKERKKEGGGSEQGVGVGL